MTILTIRTDKPESELSLYSVKGRTFHRVAEEKWEAHRQLAETIHTKLQKILDLLSISWEDIEGVVVFKGPGSFTGLRIGMTVANAIARANGVPIAARGGEDWLKTGINNLLAGQDDKIALPDYGAPANTSKPKK